MRMIDAHVTLLRAELAITGQQLGIIIGLAVGAFIIVALAGILLYVGGFLFFGELLFGSMGWGIIHGILLAAAFVGFVGINLAGGDVRPYGWGALVGLIVGALLAILLLSNAGNTGAESLRDWLNSTFVTEDLPFGDAWLVTLGGLLLGGVIVAIVAAIVGWRAGQRGQPLVGITVVGFVLGAIVGAILASTRYDAPDGVLGMAVMVGLITWIIAGILLANRKGFDPEARYADLVPTESIASFTQTKEFLLEQWETQKQKMTGR